MTKKQVLLLALVLFAGGCSPVKTFVFGPETIYGSWEIKDHFQGRMVLTFHKNEKYELDLDRNGTTDIWGEYRMAGDWITLHDTGGMYARDCGREGAYITKIAGGEAEFTIIADQCPYRAQALAVMWKRIQLKNKKKEVTVNFFE
ncbi:MAG: hypothetical protein A2Z88_08915 [Omnitrophica WOR_2 bacterium GWA2_47_8]|nr:MAG: hypothetical protein A2Z88_08915 [Omnitrophica WOR_2 bacterium GWA2_47_8]